LLEHERFEELASLAAIGELSPEEHEKFLRHKKSCSKCREAVVKTSAVAAVAFLAGGLSDEDAALENARHKRARESVARRLPLMAPAGLARQHKRLIAAGIAATFAVGLGLGIGLGLRRSRASLGPPTSTRATDLAQPLPWNEAAPAQSESAGLRALVAELQKQMEQTRQENRTLHNKLSALDVHAAELESRLGVAEEESNVRAQEVKQARNDLSAARSELSKAQALASSNQVTIDALQYKLADREARLTEVSTTLDREREMLSAGREIRDIMGARELHIVDVVDRDGRGRTKKPFGRAFYTQGKSLIFYAFDLPAKNTTDGKFVYAAWGSNSNNLSATVAHNLGIFYNDDQNQHRWAMKFDDPRILEEIDTVFVTLEPAGNSFKAPTGKPILEAYFGTPPNHP
jgi:hypothetical protein